MKSSSSMPERCERSSGRFIEPVLAVALVASALGLALVAGPPPEPRGERPSALAPAPTAEPVERPSAVAAETWPCGATAAIAAGQRGVDWQMASEARRRFRHPFHSLAIDSESRPLALGIEGRRARPPRGLPAVPGLPQAGLHEHPAQGPPRRG
jgi:hypothetical protein